MILEKIRSRRLRKEKCLPKIVEELSDDTFHMAIRPAILVGQCFGLFCISDSWSKNPSKIKFQWCSLRTVYTLTMLLGAFTCAFGVFRETYKNAEHFSAGNIGINFK